MPTPIDIYIQAENARAEKAQQEADRPLSGLAGIDPVWLAAAQGFLSPTKTGGFGESVANAAGAIQAPLKAIKDQQLSAADKVRSSQEAAAKMYLLQQKQNQSSDDDTKALFRDIRVERFLDSHYNPKYNKIDIQMRPLKALIRSDVTEPEAKKQAQKELDALQAERDALQQEHQSRLAGLGIGPRQAAEPQQNTSSGFRPIPLDNEAPQSSSAPRARNSAGDELELRNGKWVPVK
jgi:hypothetical protein